MRLRRSFEGVVGLEGGFRGGLRGGVPGSWDITMSMVSGEQNRYRSMHQSWTESFVSLIEVCHAREGIGSWVPFEPAQCSSSSHPVF